MATKKDIKALLKELGKTEADMDAYWNDLLETNWKVKQLNKFGKTWRDMNVCVIRELPTQKEHDLEQSEKARIQKESEEQERIRKEADTKYYWDHFEEIMVAKIDAKEELTEKELSYLVFEYRIDEDEGDSGRWTRHMTTIVKLCDRTFSIDWDRGLTECQDDGFYYQPKEVRLNKYEKTITVEEWVEI